MKKGLRHRSGKCEYCEMKIEYCLCDKIPKLDLQTRIVIIMHIREITIPSNTARLLAKSLKNCEVKIRGKKGDPMEKEGILKPGMTSFYLYPGKTAIELTSEFISQINTPINLIVPDGSWRQTRKVKNRIPLLSDIQEVKLPEGPSSRYFLRRAKHSHQLCTFEAIARSLGIIEGKEVQDILESLFDTMVKRTLTSRGIHNISDDI